MDNQAYEKYIYYEAYKTYEQSLKNLHSQYLKIVPTKLEMKIEAVPVTEVFGYSYSPPYQWNWSSTEQYKCYYCRVSLTMSMDKCPKCGSHDWAKIKKGIQKQWATSNQLPF